jgi:hypothetical protein
MEISAAKKWRVHQQRNAAFAKNLGIKKLLAQF